MKPSKKNRNFYLLISSPNFLKWTFFWGFIILMIPILTIIYFANSDMYYEPIFYLILAGFGVIFCGLIPFGFIPLVTKIIMSGKKFPIPKTENRVSFHELCSLCNEINNADNPYVAEPHENEGWIDITWNWKDSIDMGILSVDKNKELYYMLFKFYDDYTYDYLDMQVSSDFMLSAGKAPIKLSSHAQIGHLSNMQYQAALSKPAGGEIGIHEYRLNTNDMANYMFAWLAEHGYKYRGL